MNQESARVKTCDGWRVNKTSKKDAPVFAFAHGAGASMDSEFMEVISQILAAEGVSTYRFEFPYMKIRRELGGRRPPDRMPVLLNAWRTQIRQLRTMLPPKTKIVIGGKSMGGRVASMVADEMAVNGLLCLGYPFHPQAKPHVLRTEHLYTLTTPAFIVQGTRDALGNRQEVEAYDLPAVIKTCWLEDGNHDFKPRVRSGFKQQEHWQAAAKAAAIFIKGLH